MNVFRMQNEVQGCTASGKKLLRKRDLKSLTFPLSLKRTDVFYKVQLSSSIVQLRPDPEPSWAGREVWWPRRVWCFPAERPELGLIRGNEESTHPPVLDELHGAFQCLSVLEWFSVMELLSQWAPLERTISMFVWWTAQCAPELTDKIRFVCSPISAHTAGHQRLRPRHLFVCFLHCVKKVWRK